MDVFVSSIQRSASLPVRCTGRISRSSPSPVLALYLYTYVCICTGRTTSGRNGRVSIARVLNARDALCGNRGVRGRGCQCGVSPIMCTIIQCYTARRPPSRYNFVRPHSTAATRLALLWRDRLAVLPLVRVSYHREFRNSAICIARDCEGRDKPRAFTSLRSGSVENSDFVAQLSHVRGRWAFSSRRVLRDGRRILAMSNAAMWKLVKNQVVREIARHFLVSSR